MRKRLKKSKKNDLIIRYTLFFIGLFILTLGGNLLIYSGIGTSGVDGVVIGLANKYGLSIGTWINIVGISVIALGVLIRKGPLEWAPIVTSILLGLFHDFWGIILFDYLTPPVGEVVKGILFLIGLLVAPIGTALYILPNISTSAIDYLMISIKERFEIPIAISRILIDVVFFAGAILLRGPIGKGTIFTMLLFGPILQVYFDFFKKGTQILGLADIIQCK